MHELTRVLNGELDIVENDKSDGIFNRSVCSGICQIGVQITDDRLLEKLKSVVELLIINNE